jgi:hypothetical protein
VGDKSILILSYRVARLKITPSPRRKEKIEKKRKERKKNKGENSLQSSLGN